MNILKNPRIGKRLIHLHEKWKGKCAYCNRSITISQSTTDHFIPKCKGGTRELNNAVLSCRDCNNKKADLDPRMIISAAIKLGLLKVVIKGNKK